MDIQLIPTNDLIDELLKRHDHSIFIGMRVGLQSQDTNQTIRRYLGNAATVAGLCFQGATIATMNHLDDGEHLDEAE